MRPLTVKLAADAHAALAVFGIVGEHALEVRHDTAKQAVDLGEARNDFGAVAGLKFHKLAAVKQAAENLAHVVSAALIKRDVGINIRSGIHRLLGIVHAEEVLVVGGDSVHIFLDGLQNAFFLGVNLTEEAGRTMMDRDGSWGVFSFGVFRRIDKGLRRFGVDIALRVHAANDARAANRHVGLLVRDKDRRADGVIAAAGGVRAINANDNRNTQLHQVGMTEEGGYRP